MKRVKERFGGEYTRDNGRWYWGVGTEKTLVSGNWLLRKLNEKVEEVTPQEPKQTFNTTPPTIIPEQSSTESVVSAPVTQEPVKEKQKKITKKKKESEAK